MREACFAPPRNNAPATRAANPRPVEDDHLLSRRNSSIASRIASCRSQFFLSVHRLIRASLPVLGSCHEDHVELILDPPIDPLGLLMQPRRIDLLGLPTFDKTSAAPAQSAVAVSIAANKKNSCCMVFSQTTRWPGNQKFSESLLLPEHPVQKPAEMPFPLENPVIAGRPNCDSPHREALGRSLLPAPKRCGARP